jgi:hypothetical protein
MQMSNRLRHWANLPNQHNEACRWALFSGLTVRCVANALATTKVLKNSLLLAARKKEVYHSDTGSPHSKARRSIKPAPQSQPVACTHLQADGAKEQPWFEAHCIRSNDLCSAVPELKAHPVWPNWGQATLTVQ